MAHARRKYFEAQSSDIMHSMVMPAYFHLLYDVEREARKKQLDDAGRLALRRGRSQPMLDDIKAYRERERPRVLPKSPIGQAMAYTFSTWEALVRYSKDGDQETLNMSASLMHRSWEVSSVPV